MSRPELKTFRFLTTKAQADEGPCCLEGVLACFLSIDWVGDLFVPGCFAADLATFKSEGVIRDEHMVTTGKITHAEERGKEGLFIKGDVFETTAGKDQAILLRNKAIQHLSIGSRNTGQWTRDPEEVKALWATHGYQPDEDDLLRIAYGVRIITKARPYEASTTWLPVNEHAAITSVKGQGQPAGRTLDTQTTQALDTLGELVERAESAQKLRAAEGRTLSAKSLAKLGMLRDRLDGLANATRPTPPETKSAPHPTHAALYSEFLELEARLAGHF